MSLVRQLWMGVVLLIVGLDATLRAHEGCGVCQAIEAGTVQSEALRTISFSTGEKRLAVIRVDFEDLPGEPSDYEGVLTPSRLLTVINQTVSPYFEATSYGQSSVSLREGDITSVLRMPSTASLYAQDPELKQLESDAREMAADAGYVFDSHDRVAVLASSFSQVEGNQVIFRGYAGIGGRRSWFLGDFSPGLVAHELGHNFGLGHASSWWVAEGETDPLHVDGEKLEYGNTFDVMGRAQIDADEIQAWFGVAALAQLGWLPETAYQSVSDEGQVRLYRYDHPQAEHNHTLAVRLPLSTERAYWLSYRHAFPQLRQSLHIVRADEANRTSLLLDAHPGGSLNDSGLRVGETFSEFEKGISVNVLGTGGEEESAWLDLEIAYLPEVTFQRADISVNEDQGSVTFTLERRHVLDRESSVRWSLVSGTAVVGDDVANVSGVVKWERGDATSKVVEIPLVRDTEDESAESFVVRLSDPKGAVVPVREAVVHVIEPGVPDPTFVSEAMNGEVIAVSVDVDGSLYAVGSFDRVGTSEHRGLVHLRSSGRTDESYSQLHGPYRLPLRSVALDQNGSAWVGGDFTRFDWERAGGIMRLLPSGVRDDQFEFQLDGAVHQIEPAGDGFYLAGDFTGGVVRLTAAGFLDEAWTSGLPEASLVTSLLVLPSGDLLVAGQFPRSEVELAWGVLRLGLEGDAPQWLGEFDGVGAATPKMALGAEGEVLVVGNFDSFAGEACPGLVMLDSNGEIDHAFLQALGIGPNGLVRGVLKSPDGSWVLAGAFTRFGQAERLGWALLRADGSLDSWNPGMRLSDEAGWDSPVGTALGLQADGNVILAFSNQEGSEGRLARVPLSVTDSPGLLEIEEATWSAEHGEDFVLPVVRRRGEAGEVAVSYTIKLASIDEDDVRASPRGRLTWADGDTQPKGIRVVVPNDPRIQEITVEIGDAEGGAQTTNKREARLALMPARSSNVWLYEHFGGTANAVSAFSPEEDADQDGISNLLEYALARNPKQADEIGEGSVYPQVSVSQIGPTAEQSLEILLDLPETLRPDVRYEVLMGDGLTATTILAYREAQDLQWNVAEGVSPPYILLRPEESRQWVRFQEPIASSGSIRRFMQLRVQLLP